MDHSKFNLVVSVLSYLLITQVNCQSGQQIINTPCTASMIATFTPCMNFITGSSANGTSPSSNCCDAFKSLMSTSMDCACLLVTAGIPLPQLGNRTLAVGLPRFCQSSGVPIQCQASGSPLPPPGPLQFGPPPPPSSASSPQGELASPPNSASSPEGEIASPPSSAFSPQGSKATSSIPVADQPAPQELSPVAAPEAQFGAPPIPRIRPVLTLPSSNSSKIKSPTIWLLMMSFIMFKF